MRKWIGLAVGILALAAVATGASCSLNIQGDGNGGGTVQIEPGGIVCHVTDNSASAECFQDVTWGDHEYTLTANPFGGAEFDSWAGDCDSVVDNVCTVHFDGLDQHFEVTVTFLDLGICSTEVETQGDDPPVDTAC